MAISGAFSETLETPLGEACDLIVAGGGASPILTVSMAGMALLYIRRGNRKKSGAVRFEQRNGICQRGGITR
ncbi:MAG: hypothetical protein QGH73_12790 [Rhodospirillales bacterium]|jgi:hypothetical protein|nr:hypothetical protein [Rhodospirillales bacterium]MDP6646283.1 hypothetical protein [Rhodospirillales bacterium]MDP6842548.1 hypothetical protein [Rhodospirillales bacterium]|tara:strand:+ start:1472 stop:1687 length:216 start_codon:yes stop_codon:yes gene_type:complete